MALDRAGPPPGSSGQVVFEFPDRARGRDPNQLAVELAEQGSAHSDWGEFAANIVGLFHRILHYVNFESWGWADLKNPIGVDREIVAIINVEPVRRTRGGRPG